MTTFPADLQERYQYLGELGRGGMGVVFKAFHLQLERPVAVKLLTTEVEADLAMRCRFLQEGKLAARVHHRNVATVFETGATSQGYLYVVYEFLEGEPLDRQVARLGALKLASAVRMIIDILKGLEEIHRVGILHRDIKSANILVLPSGQPKIVDFGIARDLLSERQRTRTGEIIGTPEYMAPEVIFGRKVGLASDLYSVGILFYQMVTGRHPFEWTNIGTLLRAHAELPPPAPTRFVSEIPPALAQVMLNVLEKDPSNRPSSAFALAEAIEVAFRSAGVVQDRSRATLGSGRFRKSTNLPTAVKVWGAADIRSGRTQPVGLSKRDVRPRAVATRIRLDDARLKTRLLSGQRLAWAVSLMVVLGLVASDGRAIGRRGAGLEIKELRVVPGALEIVIASSDGSKRVTGVPTPFLFPLNVGEELSGNTGSKLVVRATDVAPVLIEKMKRLPLALRHVMVPERLNDLKSGARKLPVGRQREFIGRSLSPTLIDLWRTLGDHAAPLLAAALEIEQVDALLDSLGRIEDFMMVLNRYRIPIPVDLGSVRGDRWALKSGRVSHELSDVKFDPAEVDRLWNWNKGEAQVGFVAMAVHYRAPQGAGGYLVLPPPFLSFFDPTSRSGNGAKRGELSFLRGRVKVGSIPPGFRGLIKIGVETNQNVSLRVRINDRLTLRPRTDGPSAAEHFVKVTHRFDPRVLHVGENTLDFFAVSCAPELKYVDALRFADVWFGITR